MITDPDRVMCVGHGAFVTMDGYNKATSMCRACMDALARERRRKNRETAKRAA